MVNMTRIYTKYLKLRGIYKHLNKVLWYNLGSINEVEFQFNSLKIIGFSNSELLVNPEITYIYTTEFTTDYILRINENFIIELIQNGIYI